MARGYGSLVTFLVSSHFVLEMGWVMEGKPPLVLWGLEPSAFAKPSQNLMHGKQLKGW